MANLNDVASRFQILFTPGRAFKQEFPHVYVIKSFDSQKKASEFIQVINKENYTLCSETYTCYPATTKTLKELEGYFDIECIDR